MSTITDGVVALFHYTLTGDDGEVLDSSRERGQPLPYLHGAHNIVPGLENELAGKAVGDTLKVTVAPEQGYGPHNGMDPQPVPRGEFPTEIPLQAGVQIMAQGPDGQPFPLWIHHADDEHVFLDSNHPMAGKTLHFDVEIMRIRAATDDEKAHGHPHGPDGTAHHH